MLMARQLNENLGGIALKNEAISIGIVLRP
jgi:hypothetical protein